MSGVIIVARDGAQAVEVDADAASRMLLALRNVRALARRILKRDPTDENAWHFLRFTDEAGLPDSILRG